MTGVDIKYVIRSDDTFREISRLHGTERESLLKKARTQETRVNSLNIFFFLTSSVNKMSAKRLKDEND